MSLWLVRAAALTLTYLSANHLLIRHKTRVAWVIVSLFWVPDSIPGKMYEEYDELEEEKGLVCNSRVHFKTTWLKYELKPLDCTGDRNSLVSYFLYKTCKFSLEYFHRKDTSMLHGCGRVGIFLLCLCLLLHLDRAVQIAKKDYHPCFLI